MTADMDYIVRYAQFASECGVAVREYIDQQRYAKAYMMARMAHRWAAAALRHIDAVEQRMESLR